MVFKCTLLLLGSVKPERLDLYGEHLKSFLTTYGPRWWFLIYQADVRMRSEHFERIRRRLHIEYDSHNIMFGLTQPPRGTVSSPRLSKTKNFGIRKSARKPCFTAQEYLLSGTHPMTARHSSLGVPHPPFRQAPPRVRSESKPARTPGPKAGKIREGRGKGSQPTKEVAMSRATIGTLADAKNLAPVAERTLATSAVGLTRRTSVPRPPPPSHRAKEGKARIKEGGK